jgi:TRAP-type transport system periplasmic protein
MNRKLSRRYLLGALGVPLGTLLACRTAAAAAYTMRMSTQETVTSVQGLTAQRFAAAVGRRSNGQLTVEFYPNSSLVKPSETVEGLASGVVDFAIIQASILVPLVPRYQVFDVPFLFKNFAVGSRVLDGPIGNELAAELDSKGILGLAWGLNGFKELETTNRVVTIPEDMKNLRVRVQNSAVYVATYQALGAIPVTIDMSEAMVALTQRTVDAIEINLDAVATGKFYTVVKHVAMLNHILAVTSLVGSKRKIEALPLPLQKIVKEEAKGIVSFWRSAILRQTAEDIQILKQNGVSFTEIQYSAFRKAVEPVYAMVQAKVGGDLIDRIGRVV